MNFIVSAFELSPWSVLIRILYNQKDQILQKPIFSYFNKQNERKTIIINSYFYMFDQLINYKMTIKRSWDCLIVILIFL